MAKRSATKKKQTPDKSQQVGGVKLVGRPGFASSFIVGGLISIAVFFLSALIGIYGFILLILLLIMIIASQKMMDKSNYNDGRGWFVFSVMALFGFIFGSILLYLMEHSKRIYKWIAPISVLIIAIIVLVVTFA